MPALMVWFHPASGHPRDPTHLAQTLSLDHILLSVQNFWDVQLWDLGKEFDTQAGCLYYSVIFFMLTQGLANIKY